jgi:hypothetical protein
VNYFRCALDQDALFNDKVCGEDERRYCGKCDSQAGADT